MADVLAYPGVQAWWRSRKHWYTEEIGRVVDGIIAEGHQPEAYLGYTEPAPPK